MRPKKIILFIVIIAVIILFTQTKLFNVKNIKVESDSFSCVENSQIKSALDLFDKNILFIDYSKDEEALKAKYLCIKSVRFVQIYPDKLEVKVSGRNARFAISPLKLKEASRSAVDFFLDHSATESAEILDKNNKFFLIDEDGVIFGISERFDLVKVYYVSEFSLGEKLKATMVNKLWEIIEKCSSFGLSIEKLVVFDDEVFVDSSPKMAFRLDAKVNQQIAALQLILKKAKIDDVKLEFIDLRFDKPVVKYGERQSNLRN